jgi:hypothetical protein
MRPQEQQELIKEYFNRGGAIHRLPTPEPISVEDVLDYLEESNLRAYPAPRGEGTRKFVFQGEVVTQDELVTIVNEHRALRHLPPFQLVP